MIACLVIVGGTVIVTLAALAIVARTGGPDGAADRGAELAEFVPLHSTQVDQKGQRDHG